MAPAQKEFRASSLRMKYSIYIAVILMLSSRAYYLFQPLSADELTFSSKIEQKNNARWGGEITKQSTAKRKENQKTTTDTSNNKVSPKHIWINPVTFAEGIAGWKTSLLELLYLATQLGATLVEPCMTDGRIGSCENYNIPVGEIFDLSKYTMPSNGRKFPTLASFETYQKAVGDIDPETSLIKLCLARIRHVDKCSANSTSTLYTGHDRIKSMLHELKQHNLILHLEQYWTDSLSKIAPAFGWGLTRKKPFPDFTRWIIPFHSNHLKFVDELLQKANITNNDFNAIHWRAEKKGMDFMRCAKAVNNVKQIMLKGMSNSTAIQINEQSKTKFILLSSLNENPDMMWKGIRKEAKAKGDYESIQEALKYLIHDNGFIKVDELLGNNHNLSDPGMLAVYDLIIATKAQKFASCSKHGMNGCTEFSRKLCEECNHVGKFGHLATLFRHQSANTVEPSWECWPTE